MKYICVEYVNEPISQYKLFIKAFSHTHTHMREKEGVELAIGYP
jgi:hypothetical protein